MVKDSSISATKTTTLRIQLNKGEFLQSKVVRLEKNWILQFVCGAELLGNGVHLRLEDMETDFRELTSMADLDKENVKTYVCETIGNFKYEFFLSSDLSTPIGCGYFCVVPEWQINEHVLSLNGLSVVSHLSKLLGPFPEWEDRLRVAKEAGYNVIHLTPVQTLGISNSSYSIAEYDQLNPQFEATFKDLHDLVKKMENEWHCFTIQDVVWNHAAKNANWLWKHPESAFNCKNSPHLRPAVVVDRALEQFSNEIAASKWKDRGIPAIIDSESHLQALRYVLESEVFPSIRLHEFFQIDVEYWVKQFCNKATVEFSEHVDEDVSKLVLGQDPEFRRFGATVDLNLAVRVFSLTKYTNIEAASALFRLHLEQLNQWGYEEARDHVSAAINATMGHVTYERVAGDGPRRGAVTLTAPLVTNYFTYADKERTLKGAEDVNWMEEEKSVYDPAKQAYIMACNGWIMNADPLVNFAESPSKVYLRRELVCWGDCVKLNYGRRREDCPYLWDYMTEYTKNCATIFHGLRIDNCHSTPIHVAEYLLQEARIVRKNLYVVAELFTGSEIMDNLFVNRLGITSLIRECQNAPDSHEQGRFVYRYGGDPVGAFRCKDTRPAPACVAHALFYDQTHDNPSPYEKRTAYDYVPTAAMTAMTYCASGTTRGYDEFVPYHINVVKEKRLYHSWKEISADPNLEGMIRARRLFNDLHAEMAATGFTEIFVDQVNEDIVAVTRHNPLTHESVLCISHTCFSTFKWTPDCRNVDVADDIVDILFEVKTVEKDSVDGFFESATNKDRITGLSDKYKVEIYEHVDLNKSMAVDINEGSIHFKLFTSGSVIAFKIKPKAETLKACQEIEKIVGDETVRKKVIVQLEKLDIGVFNYLLFRCEAEEQAEFGSGAYEIPNFGKFVYCGLQGIRKILKQIQENHDLGHPLCANLRDGNWLSDYILGRLKRVPELEELARLFELGFAQLANGVPHFLRPCYFELLFSYFYEAVEHVLISKLFKNAKIPQIEITEKLAFSSVSFLASIESAKLPPIANWPTDRPLPPSLSAGLPHFAEGIWRNWGRDTFIALPGVLLLNGLFTEAKHIILAFAGTLRHGLIPNLLAEGKEARYNCRDAVWFWLASIIRYIEIVPNGDGILFEKVLRLYPFDDAVYGEADRVELLHETMYEALQRHFSGIAFRERNAGYRIDEQMTDQGFNVSARIDRETGLIFGGNEWNCGTWMDKMGSSERAGNKGQPATPRDGAAVELQGLALYVAENMAKFHARLLIPYKELRADSVSWSWEDWAKKLRNSFDQNFYVPEDCDDKFVNQRGIIKDSYGSTHQFTDFQLRPNFCVALNAVPDILEPEKSWRALETACKLLCAPLGIRTLDPTDWAYNGDYNNDDDGTNKQTAKGWNYHQGPEWVWLAGEYLCAKLKVAHLLKQKGKPEPWKSAVDELKRKIYTYLKYLNESDWSSLPELTNRNGAPCQFSCQAQAWSVGCVLEAIHTLHVLIEQ